MSTGNQKKWAKVRKHIEMVNIYSYFEASIFLHKSMEACISRKDSWGDVQAKRVTLKLKCHDRLKLPTSQGCLINSSSFTRNPPNCQYTKTQTNHALLVHHIPPPPRHPGSTSGHSAASSGAPMRARCARLCAAKAQAKGVEVSNGRAKRKAPPVDVGRGTSTSHNHGSEKWAVSNIRFLSFRVIFH